MNALTALRGRIHETGLDTALRLDDHPRTRDVARAWSHRGPRPVTILLGAVPVMPFTGRSILAPILLAVLTLAVAVGSRLADLTHDIGLEDDVACPLCPACGCDGDGNGRGRGDDDDDPTDGPLDPFTADEMHMLEFQYRTQVTA